MNWLLAQINCVRTWWGNNHEQVEENVEQGIRRMSRGFSMVGRNIARLMIIGVMLIVVDSDFPERFPVIYGWFDGWLQLGEFAVKATLNGIYSFFTGHWSEFWTEYNEACQELLQQFTNWLNTLHF